MHPVWLGLEEFIEHAFLPLPKLLEGFMVPILGGRFFVLEAISVYSNVVPKLNRQEHCVSLLTWHFACQDLDDETERISWG